MYAPTHPPICLSINSALTRPPLIEIISYSLNGMDNMWETTTTLFDLPTGCTQGIHHTHARTQNTKLARDMTWWSWHFRQIPIVICNALSQRVSPVIKYSGFINFRPWEWASLYPFIAASNSPCHSSPTRKRRRPA